MLLLLSKMNAMQAIDMVVHNESSDTAILTGTQHILALMYIVRFSLYELATCKIILLLQFLQKAAYKLIQQPSAIMVIPIAYPFLLAIV